MIPGPELPPVGVPVPGQQRMQIRAERMAHPLSRSSLSCNGCQRGNVRGTSEAQRISGPAVDASLLMRYPLFCGCNEGCSTHRKHP